VIGGYSTWKFFNPDKTENSDTQKLVVVDKSKDSSLTVENTPSHSTPSGFSENWRIVGQIASSKGRWFVVSNKVGKLRIESPSMFSGNGAIEIGEIDNERVTRWSGSSEYPVSPPPTQAPK